jgi:hypothetical protein
MKYLFNLVTFRRFFLTKPQFCTYFMNPKGVSDSTLDLLMARSQPFVVHNGFED